MSKTNFPQLTEGQEKAFQQLERKSGGSTVKFHILAALDGMRSFYQETDFSQLREACIRDHPTDSPEQVGEFFDSFTANFIPSLLDKAIPALSDFICSRTFDRILALFPDAGDWFTRKATKADFVSGFIYVEIYLRASLPFMRAALEAAYPGWTPGSVPFSVLFTEDKETESLSPSPFLEGILTSLDTALNPADVPEKPEPGPKIDPDSMSKIVHRVLSATPASITSFRVANTSAANKLKLAFDTPGKKVTAPFAHKKGGKGKPSTKQDICSTIMVSLPAGASIDHSFGGFDYSVIDAVHTCYASRKEQAMLCSENMDEETAKSLQIAAAGSADEMPLVVFTANTLWRIMNGETLTSRQDKETKADHMGKDVQERIEHTLDLAQIADIFQDRTHVLDLIGKRHLYKSGTCRDKIFHLREIGLQNYDGNTTRVFQLIAPPVLLQQAYEYGQAVAIPAPLLKIFKLDSNGKLTKAKYSNTMQRVLIKNYLLRRIIQMKRGAKSLKIRMDAMYEDCDLTDATRSQKKNAREFALACLDYWAAFDPPWIAGYKPTYTGKQQALESVTIQLPATDRPVKEEIAGMTLE